jgi:hypothetical protein
VWDKENCQLVRFDPPPGKVQPDEELLMAKYPIPQPSTFNLTKVGAGGGNRYQFWYLFQDYTERVRFCITTMFTSIYRYLPPREN